MNQDLDTLLASARLWRDRGNAILIIGILAEIVMEACWPDHPQAFALLRATRERATRPLVRWRDHFCTYKNIAMLSVGLITLAGLLLERSKGSDVDDFNNKIRANLEGENRHLRERMQRRQVETDPWVLATFSKALVDKFGVSTIFIQTISDDEAKHFGSGFTFGQIVTEEQSGIDPKDIHEGVNIYCWCNSTSSENAAKQLQSWIGSNSTPNLSAGVTCVPPRSKWEIHMYAMMNPTAWPWPFDKFKPRLSDNALLILIGKE